MNHKQILLAFSLLTVLVLAAACDLGMYDTYEKELYRIGYSGLEYSFTDFPKTDVYVNDIFMVQVDLHNKGAYTAEESILVLGSSPPLINESTASRKLDKIEGRSSYNPSGGYVPAPEIFTFKAGPIDFATEDLQVEVPVNLCYSYETIADMIGCIGARVGAFTCEFEEANKKLNLSEGQGAPLAVTDVEEIITNVPEDKVKLTFVITVENKGEGQVFRHRKYPGDKSTLDLVCGPGGYPKDTLNNFDFAVQLSTDYSFDSQTGGDAMTCSRDTHLDNNMAKIKKASNPLAPADKFEICL
ncbi:hypothetical protein KY326_01715 [Candidatus Woesearchaeota archaeon]|nr:hypothetical protein [Candidatus Woesearchaeota archaeon]